MSLKWIQYPAHEVSFKVFGLQLEIEGERRAFFPLRMNHDLTAKLASDLLRYIKTESYALCIEALVIIKHTEYLKKILLVFFFDAYSRIGYIYSNFGRIFIFCLNVGTINGNITFLIGKLEGVRK